MGAQSSIAFAADPVAPWLAGHVPPEIDLTPTTPAELNELFRGAAR